MLYIERQPAAPLRRFVQSLWYASGPLAEVRRERMLPTGCAHIVLSLSRDFLTECVVDGSDRRSAPVLLVGQRSRYEIITTADFRDLAGVHFVPGALPAFLGDRVDLISNETLSLEQILAGSADYLRSRMAEGATPGARLQILERCLMSFFEANDTLRAVDPHPAVRFALEQLSLSSSRLSVAEIARHSGWCERRFSQVFREQVGFAPKIWQRLQRFQHAVRRLRGGGEVSWAELSVECGFYDQAHFANEFRAFSGIDLTTYTAAFQRSANRPVNGR